jgi:ATP-dependent DNA helicase PIF1
MCSLPEVVDALHSKLLSYAQRTMMTFAKSKFIPVGGIWRRQDFCCQRKFRSINPPSLPPHCLCLKVGCLIILLRNINRTNGLWNGTRLICRSFEDYVIEAEIDTCVNVGNRVFMPRVALTNVVSMKLD